MKIKNLIYNKRARNHHHSWFLQILLKVLKQQNFIFILINFVSFYSNLLNVK